MTLFRTEYGYESISELVSLSECVTNWLHFVLEPQQLKKLQRSDKAYLQYSFLCYNGFYSTEYGNESISELILLSECVMDLLRFVLRPWQSKINRAVRYSLITILIFAFSKVLTTPSTVMNPF